LLPCPPFSYLTKDLSIECESKAHAERSTPLAYFMILVFSLGLPALYLALLLPHRAQLRSEGAQELVGAEDGSGHQSFRHMAFFYGDYKVGRRRDISVVKEGPTAASRH
jgi:hypothetical protein